MVRQNLLRRCYEAGAPLPPIATALVNLVHIQPQHNPTHEAQPTNMYENETFKEGADLRFQRSQFQYFPGRSTDVDFGNMTLPTTCSMFRIAPYRYLTPYNP
jgi:hypothetical protein